MRYGYHLVTDCRKANQGNKSHKDVEATIIHHFNAYTSITAGKDKPLTNDKQADILLSGITTIDNLASRNLYLDVTSTNPMGVINHESINRAALNHQSGPGQHDPRIDVLTSAKRADGSIPNTTSMYDAICVAAACGNGVSPSLLSRSNYGRARDLHVAPR